MPALFDYSAIAADNRTGAVVRLSGISKSLILSALSVMADEWRWVDNGDFDTTDAAVSEANLEVMTNAMLGTIVWVAGDTPEGMLYCDGATYQRVDFPDLYGMLDAVYIVDADNFRVPDLRGRVAIGVGGGLGVGDTGGVDEVTLSEAQIPSHTHGYTVVVPNVDLEAPGAPDVLAGGVGPVVQTGSAGGGGPHTNMQPYEALRPCLIAI